MLSVGDVAASWAEAAPFALPDPFRYGFEFSAAAILGFCLMAFVSAIETVGDVSGITKGGAGREATENEITGATFADGLGTALAGMFGGFPNTSFSQNVGLIAMTGRDEPPRGDHRRRLPDPLRPRAEGRRRDLAPCRSRCWAAA